MAAGRLSPLRVALRLAVRELGGGLAGFRVFIACIALGVAAIAAVGLTARAIGDGLSAEGRTILGGDLAVNFGSEPPPAAALAFLAGLGRVSEVTLVNSMLRRADGDGQALVRVKAVDGAYPLAGAVALEGGMPLAEALADDAGGRPGIAIEPILADRLGLAVGDSVEIGRLAVVVRALIADEPDKAGSGIAFGPRVMMNRDALARAGLVQPGSLAQRVARLALPPPAGDDALAAARTAFDAAFGKAGWRIATRANATPGLERNVDRFAEFLTLVGLAALAVGGVGVVSAVRAFIDRKRDTIATLKALGATGGFVVGLHLAEVLALAAVGVVLGLAVGVVPPLVFGGPIAAAFGLPIRVGLSAAALAVAAAYGFATALAFALWTLGRAHDVPVSALFRDRVAPAKRWPRRRYQLATLAAALLLAGIAVATAADRFVAVVFVGGTLAVFAAFALLARALMALAGRLPAGHSPELRLALRNIRRPGGLTVPVVLSLGVGLTLMVTLALIDRGLERQLTAILPAEAPTFFVLDIRNAEQADFLALANGAAPGARIDSVPMLRGRIKALRGVPVGEIEAPEAARWALDGDRGITASETLPKNSELASGAWWPAGYRGEPQVSFEDELARELGLKVGDTVTVNVLGRDVTARIASTRRLEWASLSINFVMVFSPNSFAGAPYSLLSTVTLPGGGDRAGEAAFVRAVVDRFPTATVVRVKDVLATVNGLVATLALAVRAAAAVALVAAVLVLAGALASGHRERVRDAVLLKTFGATRRRVLAAFAAEYGLLGAATAALSLAAGTAAANGVLVGLMKLGPTFDPEVAALTLAAALALTIGLGLLGTYRVLGARAAPVLRNL